MFTPTITSDQANENLLHFESFSRSESVFSDLTTALDDLRVAEHEIFLTALSRVSSYLAAPGEARAFGACSDCTYFPALTTATKTSCALATAPVDTE